MSAVELVNPRVNIKNFQFPNTEFIFPAFKEFDFNYHVSKKKQELLRSQFTDIITNNRLSDNYNLNYAFSYNLIFPNTNDVNDVFYRKQILNLVEDRVSVMNSNSNYEDTLRAIANYKLIYPNADINEFALERKKINDLFKSTYKDLDKQTFNSNYLRVIYYLNVLNFVNYNESLQNKDWQELNIPNLINKSLTLKNDYKWAYSDLAKIKILFGNNKKLNFNEDFFINARKQLDEIKLDKKDGIIDFTIMAADLSVLAADRVHIDKNQIFHIEKYNKVQIIYKHNDINLPLERSFI